MDELLAKIKDLKWMTILKSLVFNGGGSSTRWVFLASFAVLSTGYLMLCVALSIYIFRSNAQAAVATAMGVIIVALAGVVGGTSSNSQNVRHQLGAQLQSDKPIDANSTPVSADTKGAASNG